MKKIFYAIIFALLLSSFALAQNPTPSPDEDVVKISTSLIQIDVTVTDKKGNPVTDLKPEEIEIYENDQKQNISNFSFISSVKEKTIIAQNSAAGIPPPSRQVRPEQVRRTIALVVDDLTLSFQSIYYVRRALRKFVDEQMQDGDLVAIIRTGAGIGALQQFTTDRRQLYAAIEKVRWNPLGNGNAGAFAPLEAVTNNPTEPVEGLDEESRADESVASPDSFRESVFAVGTLGAIDYVVRGMNELPGRKSVMLFSDGFMLFTRGKNGFSDSSRVLYALRRLVDAANRSSVVIYTMDARGLLPTGFTAEDNTSGRTVQQIEQALTDRSTKLFDTQEGLIYLAKQTGGISITNTNDLSGGVRRMLDDQSYYLIGYEPQEDVFDPRKSRFNKLEVKVKRENVRVRYRSGFFAVSDEALSAKSKTETTPQQAIIKALTSPFAVNEIPVKLNAVFGSDERNIAYIRSFVYIDAENIKFTDEPDGKKKGVFDILAVSFGDNGAVADNISKTFTAIVDEKTYNTIKKEGLIYDFTFPVKKPGAYQLRLALRDTVSKKVGSANQFVEVPDFSKKNLMSSGVIIDNMQYEDWEKIMSGQNPSKQSDPVSSTAVRKFKAGTVLNYGTFIYNPKVSSSGKTDVKIQTKLFRDGKMIFEGREQPVVSDISDLQRINASGSLNLGTNMEAGEYVLQILITDNLSKKKRRTVSQFVPFEIVQ